ncbi:MAG: hypothetical protein COW42_12615 [Deltaproteobacteria bacterium CG17_big_fil_post_rev_8_21_14_2_50_63_7]|nr:MAG: hypothetical protein COW42_12615 [Deltaproteobacteria bacterium CG17_big_fil_post_rev_8_21_14_2_50_63_7]
MLQDPHLERAFAACLTFQVVHVAATDRKRQGVFYTPPWLALALAESLIGFRSLPGTALAQSERAAVPARAIGPQSAAAPTVLDTSCGSGTLLVAALEVLARQQTTTPATAEERAQTRLKLAPYIYGVELDEAAVRTTRQSLALACGLEADADCGAHLHCGDGLLGELPKDWPNAFDLSIANPPFGTVNRLGRRHPIQQALPNRFPAIWQDKSDISIFFLARLLELSTRCAAIVPSAIFAADKCRRFRTDSREGRHVRFLEMSDVHLFDSASVAVGLIRFERDPSGAGSLEGWRCKMPEATRTVIDHFAKAQSAPADWVLTVDAPRSGRWIVSDSKTHARWLTVGQDTSRIGERYLVGKGMETGFNAGFQVSQEVFGSLTEDERGRWLQRRIRNREIQRFALEPASTFLARTFLAQTFDELPAPLRQWLELHETPLKARAAFRRGDCEWWTFTFPLHQHHYSGFRVVTPYRSATMRFTCVGPNGGIGLTDTTAIFCPDEGDAQALAALLNSKFVADYYRGLAKCTGKGIYEFFENQIREIPLPAKWEQHIPELSALGRRAGAGESIDAQLDASVEAMFRGQ